MSKFSFTGSQLIFYLLLFSKLDDEEILMTEIMSEHDQRARCEEMNYAERKEIRDLRCQGIFVSVLMDEVSSDANMIPCRFVSAIKSKLNGKIKFKPRFDFVANRDMLKEFMVHSRQTRRPP